MADFGKVLRILRKNKKLTQKKLADDLGLAFSTISMYERGEREPDFETLEAIADYFNVSMNILLGRETLIDFGNDAYDNIMNCCKAAYTSFNASKNDIISFPVIDDSSLDNIFPFAVPRHDKEIKMPSSYFFGKELAKYFFFEVHGDSMYPEYQDGDKVLISMQSSAQSGQTCLVIYNNVKNLRKMEIEKNTIVRFVAINPNYPPFEFDSGYDENFRILGVAKLTIRKTENEI